MYKLLLVEDEDEVRRGIAAIVDWESCGFTLCGMAAGGLEAMNLCERMRPDVVMTDIFMPYMNGLEMIARVSELYPMTQYIIVSGHDDFEYVHEALQYNVLDYLLKPLAAKGIMAALRKAKGALDEALDRRRSLTNLQRLAEESRSWMDKFSLMELLANGADQGADSASLKPFEGLFPAYLGLIALDASKANEEALAGAFAGRADLRDAAILDIMQEEAGPCIRYRSHYLALLGGNQDRAVAKAERIYERIRYFHGLSCVAVVSERIEGPWQAQEAYLDAVYRVGRHKPSPAGNLYLSDGAAVPGGIHVSRIALKISSLMREGDGAALAAYCAGLAQESAALQGHAAHREFLYSTALSALLSAATQLRVPANELSAAFDRVRPMRTPDFAADMRSVGTLALALCERAAQDDGQGDRALVDRILSYIGQHYVDKDLSVEQLCEAFHISATKFSLIFKREVGTSFLQYVLDLRIQRAQSMLLNTQEKIYQIALDSGFGDAGYFSYCFKQRCGVTPKDFRRNAEAAR